MASTGERVLSIPRSWPLGYIGMDGLLQRALVMATPIENRRIDQQFVANPGPTSGKHNGEIATTRGETHSTGFFLFNTKLTSLQSSTSTCSDGVESTTPRSMS